MKIMLNSVLFRLFVMGNSVMVSGLLMFSVCMVLILLSVCIVMKVFRLVYIVCLNDSMLDWLSSMLYESVKMIMMFICESSVMVKFCG